MFAITSGASPTAISEIFGRAELLRYGGGGSQLHRHRPDARNGIVTETGFERAARRG
jgi:hypothetical protein